MIPATRRLTSAGVILLALSLVNGFLVHALPLVRLALSAHLVGLIGSAFLIGLGAGWPALRLTRRTSDVASRLAVYGFCGSWIVYFSAAATGAGGLFPIASGGARGSPLLEGVTSVALLTVALALFVFCALVLRSLQRESAE